MVQKMCPDVDKLMGDLESPPRDPQIISERVCENVVRVYISTCDSFNFDRIHEKLLDLRGEGRVASVDASRLMDNGVIELGFNPIKHDEKTKEAVIREVFETLRDAYRKAPL